MWVAGTLEIGSVVAINWVKVRITDLFKIIRLTMGARSGRPVTDPFMRQALYRGFVSFITAVHESIKVACNAR